jgi:hypothetical protein
LLLQAVLLLTLLAPRALAQDGNNSPPVAKKVPHETRIHGYTLKGDYFWLREKTNPEVIKYLEDENAYTEEVMKRVRVTAAHRADTTHCARRRSPIRLCSGRWALRSKQLDQTR